jgi:hypothetical protein
MKRAALAAGVAGLAFMLGPSLAPVPVAPVPVPALPANVSDAATFLGFGHPSEAAKLFTFEDLPKAWQRLALCESSGRPAVRGGKRGQYRGLFQIEFPRTWVAHGGELHDPPSAANVSVQYGVAMNIWKDRGSSPWPHCGKYLREVYGR